MFIFEKMTRDEEHHHVDNWYSDVCETSDNHSHELEEYEIPESHPVLHSPENDRQEHLLMNLQQMIDGTFWEYRNSSN